MLNGVLRMKWFAALCLAVMALSLLAGCGGSKPRMIGGISIGEHRVIATVNGVDIYEDVFMEWYLTTIAMGAGLDMTTPQNEEVVNFIETYRQNYLTGYAEQIALLQEAERRGFVPDDQRIDEQRQLMELEYMGDEEGFQTLLDMLGFTEATFRQYLSDQLAIMNMIEDVTKDITEPDQTPEAYFYANPEEFGTETRMVRHILVDTLSEADEIIAMLNDGADFAELVMTRSTDPGAEFNMGSYGPFDAMGMMSDGNGLVEPFATASFSLANVGDITQTPSESEFGYHIIILDEIIPPQSLDMVRDDLLDQLMWETKDRYFDEFYQQILEVSEIIYVE